jgi:hypothetical protein
MMIKNRGSIIIIDNDDLSIVIIDAAALRKPLKD